MFRYVTLTRGCFRCCALKVLKILVFFLWLAVLHHAQLIWFIFPRIPHAWRYVWLAPGVITASSPKLTWPYDQPINPIYAGPHLLAPLVWMCEQLFFFFVQVSDSAGRLVFCWVKLCLFLLKQTAASPVLHLHLTLYLLQSFTILCLVINTHCKSVFRHQSEIPGPISSVTWGSVSVDMRRMLSCRVWVCDY